MAISPEYAKLLDDLREARLALGRASFDLDLIDPREPRPGALADLASDVQAQAEMIGRRLQAPGPGWPSESAARMAGGRLCGTCGGDHWTRDHDDHVAADRAYESADLPESATAMAAGQPDAELAPCGCPRAAGMIRHQSQTCTDPVAARLDWYADRPAGGSEVSADQPAAPAVPAVYGPHCSHDDCPFVGPCGETGLIECCCRFPGCPECGGLRNGPEDWGSDPARFAAMTPDVQERVRAYWARYPLVRRGPDDTAERAGRDLADHPWWCDSCPSPTICAPAGRCADRLPRQQKEN